MITLHVCSISEICAVSKISKKEIGRAFKLILKNLETSVELITTGDFMVCCCASFESFSHNLSYFLPVKILFQPGFAYSCAKGCHPHCAQSCGFRSSPRVSWSSLIEVHNISHCDCSLFPAAVRFPLQLLPSTWLPLLRLTRSRLKRSEILQVWLRSPSGNPTRGCSPKHMLSSRKISSSSLPWSSSLPLDLICFCSLLCIIEQITSN